MKREMELIRELLLYFEDNEPRDRLTFYTQEQKNYHAALLVEAGLVHGEIIDGNEGEIAIVMVKRLTWAGHEFLDAARNDSVWHEAREKIKKSGVDVTITILKELLTNFIKGHLNMPISGH